METLHFEIDIHAPHEEVYSKMLAPKTFSEWTAAFSSTSTIEGTWETGSKMLFKSLDKDGNPCGMISRIKDNQANTFVSIEHLGILENGNEIYDREDILVWKGMLEEYTYIKQGNGTRLKVRMDTTEEWKAYFTETYPKALNILKSICENR